MFWLALALACSSTPPIADPAPSRVEEAPAPPPAPEVAPPAPAEPEGPKPVPAEPTLTESSGHCVSGEVEFFGCEVDGGKVASLCGVGAGLQYRYDRPGTIELSAPEPASIEGFRFTRESWARSQATAVSLVNDDVVYWLIDKSCSGAMGEGEMNNFNGLEVLRGQETLASMRCKTQARGDLDALGDSLPQVGYMEP